MSGTAVPLCGIVVHVSQTTTFADYRTALTASGARGPVLASLAARLPIAMVGFSVLLYVQRVTGSFATAGVVAAGMLLGVAVGSVAQGRIIDRLGPTRPIMIVTAAFGIAIAALVTAIEADAPTALLVGLAAVAGLSQPMIASASRSLWSRLLPQGSARDAAYAYEAISMEVFFILGPGIAGLLMAAPWAGTGVVIGAAVMVVGSCAFALCPAVLAWRARGDSAPLPLLGALSSHGMRTVALAALGFGVVIGFVEVAVPATATAAGHNTTGGLLLSVWSLSSVIFGLLYSLRPWPRPMQLRLPVLLAAFGVLVGLLALPTALAPSSMLILAGAMIFAGSLITPQATAHSSAIELVAPRGTATEAFGWIITAVMIGVGLGQSISGYLVEAYGPPISFIAAAVSGMALAALVLARKATVATSARSLLGTEVVQLGAHAELGRSPQHRVDVGVDQFDDLARACVRP